MGAVDHLDRVLLRSKLLRNLIGDLHAQPRRCAGREREVCDEDGAISRLAIRFSGFLKNVIGERADFGFWERNGGGLLRQ